MTQTLRNIGLIAKSILLEAIRRKEVYVVVFVACLIIGTVMTMDFFQIQGITKFYREVALKVMSLSTGLMVVLLSARQLPREFKNRTIYPLLAKPISRNTFLLGKLVGAMAAAAFCFALFMAVYLTGSWYLGGDVPWALFFQYVYLQMLMMAVLSTLSFLLSMTLTLSAATTIVVLLFILSATITSATTFVYYTLDQLGQWVIAFLTYLIPQFTLFDLSAKAVHAQQWEPLSLKVMMALTLYAGIYCLVFFVGSALLFKKKAL